MAKKTRMMALPDVKECGILGGGVQNILTPSTYFQGVKTTQPKIYAPAAVTPVPCAEWHSATGVAARRRRSGAEDGNHQSAGGQHVVLVGNALTGRLDGSQLRRRAGRKQTRVRAYSHCQRVGRRRPARYRPW